MSFSSLTNVIVPADRSNFTATRNARITKITVHHVAGNLTAEQVGRIFQNPSRNASSNYGIGTDGRIGGYVSENSRAWTSSNAANDHAAITIEVSNNGGAPNWPVSNQAWNSLVNLCVDICRRHNFRLTYDGTPKGSLTRHNMFINTTCPGPFLQSRFPQLVTEVNRRLDNTDTYTVVAGDTLAGVARRFNTTVNEIVAINPIITNPNLIRVGWVLNIPSGDRPSQFNLTRMLRRGTSGNDVRELQSRLNNLGIRDNQNRALTIDGIFGPRTEEALRNFQRAQRIGVDGIVGPITASRLGWLFNGR